MNTKNKIITTLAIVTLFTSIIGVSKKTQAETLGHFDYTLISPSANSTNDDHLIDVEIEFKLNANHGSIYVNKEVEVLLVDSSVSERPEYPMTTNNNVAAIQKLTLSSLSETKKLTFTDTKLLYQGENYFFVMIRENQTIHYMNKHSFVVNHTGSKTPLYRFWSLQKLGHFYTANNAEKEKVVSSYVDYVWKYEDIAYYITPTTSDLNCNGTGKSPIFRFWNATVQHHFYTGNEGEKNTLISSNPAWAYEGVAFCSDKTPVENTTPVYRFYSPSKVTHFYTANEAEKNHLISTDPSWKYEDIAYYAYK